MNTAWRIAGLEQIYGLIIAEENHPLPDDKHIENLERSYNEAREQLRAIDPDGLADWEMGQ